MEEMATCKPDTATLHALSRLLTASLHHSGATTGHIIVEGGAAHRTHNLALLLAIDIGDSV